VTGTVPLIPGPEEISSGIRFSANEQGLNGKETVAMMVSLKTLFPRENSSEPGGNGKSWEETKTQRCSMQAGPSSVFGVGGDILRHKGYPNLGRRRVESTCLGFVCV